MPFVISKQGKVIILKLTKEIRVKHQEVDELDHKGILSFAGEHEGLEGSLSRGKGKHVNIAREVGCNGHPYAKHMSLPKSKLFFGIRKTIDSDQ